MAGEISALPAQKPAIRGLRWFRFTADSLLEVALDEELLRRVVAEVNDYRAELERRNDLS